MNKYFIYLFIKMVKISIIVPIYNVEKYLERCLESLEKQTYKNIEIILINDGSTDSSEIICKKFILNKCKKYIYIKQQNGGLSKARNIGIENATGEYIFFLDSDDYLNVRAMEVLEKNAIENNADIVICDLLSVKLSTLQDPNVEINFFEKLKEVKKQDFYLQRISNHSCGKLYKKSLFIENNIYFPENRAYEDVGTTYKLIENSDKIFYLPIKLYYYLDRENSISHTFSNKNITDLLKSFIDIHLFFKDKRTEFTDYYELTILFTLYTRLKKGVDIEQKDKIEHFIKKTFKKISSRVCLYKFYKSPMIIKLYLFKYNLINILLKIKYLKEK